MDKLIIAIDGPSGGGKSTLGKALARHFNYLYIDSGAVYRAVARKALDAGVPLDDGESVARIARNADIRLEGDPDHLRVYLDGRDVSREIRLPDASHASSVIAIIPEVRAAVVDKLREMSRAGGVVMDGRDIGTKVFPHAQVKLFLDASLDVRARRRADEERGSGRKVTAEEVRAELEERDLRDSTRAATPLVKAEDAIFIDTSDMPLEEVINRVLEIICERQPSACDDRRV
jgi:cytidylate kinase